MAKRYIGDAVIRIAYHDEGDYRGTVSARGHVWHFRDMHAPRLGGAANRHGYDSPEAYDELSGNDGGGLGLKLRTTRGPRLTEETVLR